MFCFCFFSFKFFFFEYSYNKISLSSFECGFDSLGNIQISFSLHFFFIMMVFIIFDMELVIFLGFLFLDYSSFVLYLIFYVFIYFTFLLEYYLGKLFWVV